MDVQLDSRPITLTDRAAARISEILASEPKGSMLRVAVDGGGCSGFQYRFEIVTSKEDDDLLLEKNGAQVLVDSLSQDYMPGATIDFADELIAAAFKIDNPLAKSGCGCGTSFSIA
ncbi:MAG: iron-sulfur cluster insertion protein ErpA [Pseudomonadota bacterium]